MTRLWLTSQKNSNENEKLVKKYFWNMFSLKFIIRISVVLFCAMCHHEIEKIYLEMLKHGVQKPKTTFDLFLTWMLQIFLEIMPINKN